ncbi:MAG: redoxin domain-containing protein [Acidobacteria bacterium]|nr:redoxin domain-containing protein [Acidobacteriota bacterium]
MKTLSHLTALFTILFVYGSVTGQDNESAIQVVITKDSVKVKGLIQTEQDKERISSIIEKTLEVKPDISGLKANMRAPGFHFAWESDLEKVLKGLGKGRSGLISFRRKEIGVNGYRPRVPDSILTANIELVGKQKIKLSEIPQKNVILLLGATWSTPVLEYVPSLNKLRKDHPENELRIFYVAVDDHEDLQKELPGYLRKHKIEFEVGWAEEELVNQLLEVSNFDGIPQVFVLRDGKIIGVFKGGAKAIIKQMETTVSEQLGTVK